MTTDPFEKALTGLGVTVHDKGLFRRALTHPSWSLENGGDDYERLEFLGDAVLSSVVASFLYERFPEQPEGFLTRMKIALTSGRTLAEVGAALGLGEAMLFGKGAVRERCRDSVLEAAVEAVVGAVYLDSGQDAVQEFVLRVLGDRIDPETLLETTVDAKTRLQELSQSRGQGLPSYEIVGISGPAHDPVFEAVVRVAGDACGMGTGPSKQAAQQAAAAAALIDLE